MSGPWSERSNSSASGHRPAAIASGNFARVARRSRLDAAIAAADASSNPPNPSSSSSSSTVNPASTVGDAAVAMRSPTTSHGPSSMPLFRRIARYARSIDSTSSFRMNSPKSTNPSPSLSQSSYSVSISPRNRPGEPSPVRSSMRTAVSNSSRVMPRLSSTSKNAKASSLVAKPRSSIFA